MTSALEAQTGLSQGGLDHHEADRRPSVDGLNALPAVWAVDAESGDVSDASGPAGRLWPVVVGVDGSLEAVEAAQFAAQAAGDRRLDLLVVHAFTAPNGLSGEAAEVRAAVHDAAQRVVEDALSQVRVPVGVRVWSEVEPVLPGELLLRLSRTAAVVVLGQHAFDIADQLVEGSVAPPLAYTAHCPVIVVPRGWRRTARRGRIVAVVLEDHGPARALLALAIEEAERHRSSVVALHALPGGGDVDTVAARARNIEGAISESRAAHPDLVVSVRLVTGDLTQAVLDTSQDARLVVVGRTHHPDRSGLRGQSVAEAVLAEAGCPLLVMP